MANSVDSEASTDRVQDGGLPAFFTEDALLRLEAGLRAQREQQDGRLFEPDTASSRPGNSGAVRDRLSVSAGIRLISEKASLAPGAEQPEFRKEQPVPLRRRRKVALLLSALLLVVGAATLGVSLKSRTGRSTDAAPVNIEGRERTASAAPNNDGPRQPIANAVRSSASKPSLPRLSPAPSNQQPVEAQGPTTPAASGAPAPPNEQPVEAQAPAASGTPAARPACNIPVCRRFYRSFRASDCTFQPLSGRRRICNR
jgi:hypothetical protein